MLLVADANVLFKILIGRGNVTNLFFLDNLRIIAPEFLFKELAKNKAEILKKSKLPEKDFDIFTSLLMKRIDIIPSEEVSDKSKEKAKLLAPHIKDEAYFAVALDLKASIWSDEKAFKKQSSIKIYNTSELMDLFKSNSLA